MLSTISLLLAGATLALGIQQWATRKERELQEKRKLYLFSLLDSADKFPGGREFVRAPYNEFVRGTWLEEYSRNHPRKEFKAATGVRESA